MRRFLFFFITIFGLFSFDAAIGASGGQQAPPIKDEREAFAIGLPEVGPAVYPATMHNEIFIPSDVKVTRLNLWVLQPYDLRFGYDIKAMLNGKALATVSQRRSGKYGNYLDVDFRQQPSLQLISGKNVVEIFGTERDSRQTYRCSFVLRSGERIEPRQAFPEIRFEKVLASSEAPVPENDQVAPELTLSAPVAPPAGTDEAFALKISGFATDDSGTVATIKLNGQVIAIAPVTKSKEEKKKKKGEPPASPPLDRKLAFDHTIKVESRTNALLLEASDPTGNRALAYIPIHRMVPLADESGFGGRRYAVIIGISKYQYNEGGLNNLSYAHTDAIKLAEFLRSPGGGGFKQEDILCLTDGQATRDAINDSLKRFLTKAGPNDLVYLFLGGHGAPDKQDAQKLYFLLHDTKVNELGRTALSMSEIGDFLAAQSKGVRLIAFFDTCHSAGINRQPHRAGLPPKAPIKGNAKGVGVDKKTGSSAPAPPPVSGPNAPPASGGFNFYDSALFRKKGWTVLSSSGMNELSQESDIWGGGHGVFTWAVLEGAKGKADADNDCRITSAELNRYVIDTVRSATGNAQTPQVLPGSNPEMVIAVRPGCRAKQ